MNRAELKQKIKENVYQNAFGEITGDNLQKVLLDMVDFSNKANDENFEKEEIVIVNPQGYYVPSRVKINDIGSNLTAGENIKIEDDTISAIGYKYNEEKNSISIDGGEKTVTITNNGITEEIVVEGKTQAVGKNSFASGFNSIAYGDCSHTEGGGIPSGSIGMSGAIIPNVNFAYGEGSHAEGLGTFASGIASHAEGTGDTKIVNFEVHKMTQEIADVLINDPQFSGGLGVENTYYSTDESIMQGSGAIIGYNSNSSGFTGLFLYNNESQSIGGYIGNPIMSCTTTYNDETMFVFQYSGSIGIEDGQYISWLNSNGCAYGDFSHAEGEGTTASGEASHAEGGYTTASGYCSHSEGASTNASGYASHAEGFSTKAEGDFSHAEGGYTTASGYSSHAEGSGSIAFGSSSHAEGRSSKAEGDYSHAEGSSTNASGYASHAEGSGSIAFGSSSHAEGNPGYMNTYRQQEQFYEWDEEGNENIIYVDNYNWEEGTNIINCVNLSIYDFNTGDVLIIEKYDEWDNLIEGPINVKIVNIDYENSQIEIDYTLYFDAQYTQLALIKYAAIGDCSHREGSSTTALGNASHSEGVYTTALGNASHSEGEGTIASGSQSHSEGFYTVASGDYSHAEGGYTKSEGDYSHAEGSGTIASGNYSHAEGSGAVGIGSVSHAEGEYTTASGDNSHAEGSWTNASGHCSHAEGSGTKAEGNYSHAEGANTNAEGSNSHTEGASTTASGYASHSEGSGTIASGYSSHAEGANTIASGHCSHAEGSGTKAEGNYSHAEGAGTVASGDYSHAGGFSSQAKGESSFVHGRSCTVDTSGTNAHTIGIDNYINHSGSIGIGKGLTSYRQYCTYLGQYNKQLPGEWDDTIVVVGDGTDSSNKRNIVVIQSGNEPAVHCRGAIKNDATWINDFGEYFEWADGNPNNEDRVGYMVQLNEAKIELAQSIDEFIGVVSATAGFIGGACSLDWHGIYLRDVFGRYITDENGNPVINPEYDENKNYIPREKRPEWDIVGLLGQVVVRQDGTLKVGKYIDCKNGVATSADSGKYKVLKVINNDVALILIK